MTRSYPVPDFKVGDRVAYSVQFLQSICESHGDIGHARGAIRELRPIPGGSTLASITWDQPGVSIPAVVNVANLALIGPNPRFCKVD